MRKSGGFTLITHSELHHGIYEELIRVARAGQVTYYSNIAPMAGLDMSNPVDRNEIATILFRISSYEHQLGNPMLSAVVVLKEQNSPGKGFFTLAAELALYSGTTSDDEDEFLIEELNRVHSHWS